MQAFVAILTAVLLFIHAVCGCCWHHAHACGHAVAAHQPAACCHHEHQSDGQESEWPGQCKVECEGACTYVAPQKVRVEAPEWTVIDLLAVLPSLNEGQVGKAASWEALSSLPEPALPLRKHLLHQVLLN